jgi:hypothetical protein
MALLSKVNQTEVLPATNVTLNQSASPKDSILPFADPPMESVPVVATVEAA